MAEIKEGILGGVNGTVGTVVGFSWRGRDFLRARPKRSNKPASVLQRLQRDKMSLISIFTSQVKDFVNAHYPRVLLNNKMATGKEQLNSRLLKKGIVILDGEPCIDLEQVLLSMGILPPAAVKKISKLKSGRIKMQWDNSISNALTAPSDTLTVVAYHEETNAFTPLEHIALRGDKYAHIALPNAWEQGTVHFWSVWKSADGEYISTSTYHGKLSLEEEETEPDGDNLLRHEAAPSNNLHIQARKAFADGESTALSNQKKTKTRKVTRSVKEDGNKGVQRLAATSAVECEGLFCFACVVVIRRAGGQVLADRANGIVDITVTPQLDRAVYAKPVLRRKARADKKKILDMRSAQVLADERIEKNVEKAHLTHSVPKKRIVDDYPIRMNA